MKWWKGLLLGLPVPIGAIILMAQSSWPPPVIATVDPSGACANGTFWVNISTPSLWYCGGSTWNQAGAGSGVAPGSGNVYVVDTTTGGACGSTPHCYEVSEARVTADGATTSGSPTVTSATINFTSADVGKVIYAVVASTGALDQRGHVLSVTNSTTAVSDTNSTATATGLTLVVASDAAPNLHTAYQTALSENQGISIPCGTFLLDSNAPVFDLTPYVNQAIQGFGISGCSASGSTNSTLFVLGPDLQDTGGSLVAYIPLNTGATVFPFFNRGSSWGVSDLQITGLSYKASNASTNYVINTPRAFNVRIYDVNTNFGCWDVADTGTFSGEEIYERLNLQVNHNGFATQTCSGVLQGTEGDNVISDSVIAYLTATGVQTSGTSTLRNDYITNVGGTTSREVNVGGGHPVNIIGGVYVPNSQTVDVFFLNDSTTRLNIFDAVVDMGTDTVPYVFKLNGGSVFVQNTTFKNVTAAHMFESNLVGSSFFYSQGGNTINVLPTTNIPKYLSAQSEAGKGTCAASTATITFAGTYLAAPVVNVTSTVSAGTAQVTATSTTTATVACSGATDTFNYAVTPNPF